MIYKNEGSPNGDVTSLEDFRKMFTFELRGLHILEQAMDQAERQDRIVATAVGELAAKRGEWFVDGDEDGAWDSTRTPSRIGNDPEQLREPIAA